jgi:RNA methyltransferase, TrmH family
MPRRIPAKTPQSEHNHLIAHFRGARRNAEFAVLEGFHALKHALRFKADLRNVVTHDPGGLELLAEQLGPDVRAAMTKHASEVPTEIFEQLSPSEQVIGVISIAMRPIITREMLLALSHDAPIVLLESPTHLGNVGAVVRVAAAAGAAAVVTTGNQDPWHPNAIRGSAGLHFAIPVTRTDDYALKGRPLIAIDPDGEELDIDSIPSNAILAFGSERAGLSDELLARADKRVRIPMASAVSSLNLATAVAVVLYAWRLRKK